VLYPLSYGGLPCNMKNTTSPDVVVVHRFWPRECRGIGWKCGKHGRGVTVSPTLSDVSGVSGRVLVVDDSEVIRQLIRVNLELEGFEVVTAADGAECLEIVQQVQPDVITLDVVMPRLDGLRTAARLRADARTARYPIAIVSACTTADLERGASVGVDGYIAKPFEPMELVALVRRLARNSGSRERGEPGEPGEPGERDGQREAGDVGEGDSDSGPGEGAEPGGVGRWPGAGG
jgi:CheY-like chemotaxis protein